MSTQPVHILFVEDEAFFRDFYGKELEKNGFSVSYAKNGEDALILLKKKTFDVVVTDLIMPMMSGTRFLDALGGRVPFIIVLTALSGETDRQDALNKGARYFCIKDETDAATLVGLIHLCLKSKDPLVSKQKRHKKI